MLTISVSCADESLEGSGDDRTSRVPDLSRDVEYTREGGSPTSHETSTNHAEVRSRGCGAGGVEGNGSRRRGLRASSIFLTLKPFLLVLVKYLRLKDQGKRVVTYAFSHLFNAFWVARDFIGRSRAAA